MEGAVVEGDFDSGDVGVADDGHAGDGDVGAFDGCAGGWWGSDGGREGNAAGVIDEFVAGEEHGFVLAEGGGVGGEVEAVDPFHVFVAPHFGDDEACWAAA